MRFLLGLAVLVLLAGTTGAQPTASPGGTEDNRGPNPVLEAPADDHERYPDYVRPTPPCGGPAPTPSPAPTPIQADQSTPSSASTASPSPTQVTVTDPATATPTQTASPPTAEPAQVSHESLAPGSDAVAIDPNSPDRDDSVRFWYDSFNGRVRFAYLATDDAPARGLELQLLSVVEYRDENGNGKFELGELSLQEFRINEPLTHFSRTIEDDCGFRLRWTYLLTVAAPTINQMRESEQKAFLEDKPRLTFQFTHSDAQGPQRVKIDFAIDDFPFEPERSDTRLAIRTSVYSLDRLVHSGDRLEGAHEGAAIGYSWDPTATADGETVDVPVSVEEEDPRTGVSMATSAFSVTFNYPHAAHVLHDPQLGLFTAFGAVARLVDLAAGHPLGYVAGVAAAAVVMGGLVATRRRFP